MCINLNSDYLNLAPRAIQKFNLIEAKIDTLGPKLTTFDNFMGRTETIRT